MEGVESQGGPTGLTEHWMPSGDAAVLLVGKEGSDLVSALMQRAGKGFSFRRTFVKHPQQCRVCAELFARVFFI